MNIICSGDFNARTANYQVNQAYVQNYGSNVTDRIKMWECSQISQSSQLNDFGRRLLELLSTMFYLQLVNRYRPWDMHGKFTFMSDQSYSVMNCFLISSSLCDFVQKIVVEDRIESDHMPVELYCNFYTDPDSIVGEKAQQKRKRYFGVKTKYMILNSTLHLSEFRDCIVRATSIMDDCINASMEIFTQALLLSLIHI